MQAMKPFTISFAMILIAVIVHAQNIFWLQGTWRGKAYLPGSEGSQYYILVMNVSAVKDNKFEGIIATMQPNDTSYRFDSKISGVVYDKYVVINRTRILYVKDAPDIKWKVSCNNCKPPRMIFSMENGKIFFRGEEKDCYKECNGVSEFSKDITEFDSSKKEALVAYVNNGESQQHTALLTQNDFSASANAIANQTGENIFEQRRTPAGTGDVTAINVRNNINSLLQKETVLLHKEISLTIKEDPPSRITLLPAGDVVATTRNSINLLPEKEIVSLHKEVSLMLRENPPPRLTLLPAGSVVATTVHNNINSLSHKEMISPNKEISLMIKENPLPRIALLPAGDIVTTTTNNSTNSSSQKEIVVLRRKTSLHVKQNPLPRLAILSTGDIVSTKQKPFSIYKRVVHPVQHLAPVLVVRQNTVQFAKVSSIIDSTSLAVKKDTAQKNIVHHELVALPSGYAERKKSVIRTITVNTDSVVLRVYDNGIVDGDIVSVVYNDNVVIDKLSLTSRAVVVKIPVNPSQINTLVFHAHNLGEYPPNTAKLEILYGNRKEELTVSSDLTVSSTIDIVHQ